MALIDMDEYLDNPIAMVAFDQWGESVGVSMRGVMCLSWADGPAPFQMRVLQVNEDGRPSTRTVEVDTLPPT